MIDRESHRFYLRGSEVYLRAKLFKLLMILLDRAPRALTKAELQNVLWPNTFVSDDALARLISDLRVAIGDNGSPRIIRTVHGYGYALNAESLDEGGGTVSTHDGMRVGTHESMTSRAHARIVIADGLVQIEDLGGGQGTYVGGQRVAGVRPLCDGDVIRVGSCRLTFSSDDDDLPIPGQSR